MVPPSVAEFAKLLFSDRQQQDASERALSGLRMRWELDKRPARTVARNALDPDSLPPVTPAGHDLNLSSFARRSRRAFARLICATI